MEGVIASSQCHVTHFKFGGPIHISGMAEAGAVKFCTLSLIKRMKYHPKRGVVTVV